mgnify:CR=1 FL=1
MATAKSRRTYWIWWGALSVALGGYLSVGLLSKSAATNPLLAPAREVFMPGRTSHGHYQIELACESCHVSPFGGREALQQSCERCHGQELKDAVDKHPRSKFTDPRNADRLEKLLAAVGLTAVTSTDQSEITRRGDPDFCTRAGIWAGVAATRGHQMVADGALSESARGAAEVEYRAWLGEAAQSHAQYLRAAEGVRP